MDVLYTPGPMVFTTGLFKYPAHSGKPNSSFPVAQDHRNQLSMTATHDAYKDSLSFTRPVFT